MSEFSNMRQNPVGYRKLDKPTLAFKHGFQSSIEKHKNQEEDSVLPAEDNHGHHQLDPTRHPSTVRPTTTEHALLSGMGEMATAPQGTQAQ